MLKYVVFSILCLCLTVSSAFCKTKVDVREQNDRKEIDSIQCDNENTGILEVGNSYNFDVDFYSNDGKVKVNTVRFWFWADEDYNGSDRMIEFSQTDKIKNLDGVVGQEKVKLVESTPYVIKKQPKESSTENVLVKYEILFNSILPDGSLSKKQESYVQCGRYTVMKPKAKK